MLTPPNRVAQARASTLIAAAEGGDLAELSDLYGLLWARLAQTDAQQRAILRATLYSARGTYPATLSTLRELYRPLEIRLEGATRNGEKLEHPDITPAWAGRWVFWEEAGAPRALFVVQSATDGEATLETARTLHHTAPGVGLSFTPTEGAASLAPWTAREPCPGWGDEAAPNLDKPATLIINTEAPRVDVPPSYYHEGDDPTETASGEPYGHHTLDLFDGDPLTPSLGDQTLGPYPLYFPGAGVDSTARALLDQLLAAGVRLEMNLSQDGDSPFNEGA